MVSLKKSKSVLGLKWEGNMWTNTAVTFHKLLDKSNIDIHNYMCFSGEINYTENKKSVRLKFSEPSIMVP